MNAGNRYRITAHCFSSEGRPAANPPYSGIFPKKYYCFSSWCFTDATLVEYLEHTLALSTTEKVWLSNLSNSSKTKLHIFKNLRFEREKQSLSHELELKLTETYKFVSKVRSRNGTCNKTTSALHDLIIRYMYFLEDQVAKPPDSPLLYLLSSIRMLLHNK